MKPTLFTCLALSFLTVAAVSAAPLTEARVTKIINDVSVVEGAARKAQLQDVIKGQTGLKTGIKSRSELLFEDNTLTRIGPESYFSFKAGTRDMTLEQGTMLLQVPKGLGGAKIRTAAVTAAITGTTIMLEYRPNRNIKVVVLEGSLRLSANGSIGNSVLLEAGKMVIMPANAKRIPDPVSVDLKKIMKTSSLVNMGGNKKTASLPSAGLIEKEIANQQKQKDENTLVDTNLVILGKGTNVVLASDDLLTSLNRNTDVSTGLVTSTTTTSANTSSTTTTTTTAAQPAATPAAQPASTPTAQAASTPAALPGSTPPPPQPGATPTLEPGSTPAATPAAQPSATPAVNPTATPGANPTATPAVNPTATPAVNPTATPAAEPTATPAVNPTATPAVNPTATPGTNPSPTPAINPDPSPTPGVGPSPTPAPEPSATPLPSATPGDDDEDEGDDNFDDVVTRDSDSDLVIDQPIDLSKGGRHGKVSLKSRGTVTVKSTIKVSDSVAPNASQRGGSISIRSQKKNGTAISIRSSAQLLSLLDGAAPGPGGEIKFRSAGGAVNINGAKVQADRGKIDISNSGENGAIAVQNANLSANAIKLEALGKNGQLNIGGGTMNANSAIDLYASGSNGQVNFNDNVTLSGTSVKTIAGHTVSIANDKTVTISGSGPANVYTNNPNYTGSGGNGSRTGQFGGAGATTQPFSSRPGGR